MKVLIAEDSTSARKYLTTVVQHQGYQYLAARDGREALQLFEEERPDLVITDIQMPHMDGFELLEAIRAKDENVIVVIITGEGSEQSATKALHLGANNYLHKPITDKQLLQLLRKYATLISEREVGHEMERMVASNTLDMQVDNRIEITTRVAQFLVDACMSTFSEKQRLDITLGLDELLTNAIEHGNLGIKQTEKEEALYQSDGLHKLHTERLSNPKLADRRITIHAEFKRGRYCEWTIADEGDGFDWEDVPDPLSEEAITKPSGRGIFLSRMIFDHVEYRGKGNTVFVRKNL
jgi:DNA-binding response OmpR family regulator